MKHLGFLCIAFLLLLGCKKERGPYDFEILTTKGFIDTSQWRGETIIVFFGFTHCPHICPTVFKTLNHLKQDKLKVVFISVDYHRDSIQHMQNHPMIGKHIYAGTSHETVLKNIAAQFETSFDVKLNKDGEPIVNHASHVFIIDPSGKNKAVLDYDSTTEAFQAAVKNMKAPQPPVGVERFPPEVARNDECDLDEDVCIIKYQGQTYQLEFKHRPVKDNDYQTLLFTTSTTAITPLLVDITGVDLNMGLIRPAWLKELSQTFSSSFRLPYCELPQMRWKASVLLRDQNNQEFSLRYSFKTKRL